MQKDKTGKILEDYNDVFADIYNVLVFGEKYLDEDGLETGPTESVYKAESGKLKEQRRDMIMQPIAIRLISMTLHFWKMGSPRSLPVTLDWWQNI